MVALTLEMCCSFIFSSCLQSNRQNVLFIGNSEEKCPVVLLFLLLDESNLEADLQ